MITFDGAANVNWIVPNDSPKIATADGGVIGTSGITYDAKGNATGQLQNSAVLSWSSRWYADPPDSISLLGLPLPDISEGSNFSGFAGGNPSQNGAAFPQCCTPSLEGVLGLASSSTVAPSKSNVSKAYPLNEISCGKSPAQVISDMEQNFGSFANYSGNFGPLGIPAAYATVSFTGTVSLGSTVSIHNLNIITLPNLQVTTKEFNVAVQVTQINSTSFTFTTLPGHVLYPATISFSANSSQAGHLGFSINVNGQFANLGAEIGY